MQPRPNRWRSRARPSRPVLPGDPHVQLQEDGQVLRIPSSHLGDEGRYQCVAFSPAGQQAKDFRLRMQGEPGTPVTAARCTVSGRGRDGGPGGGAPRSNKAVGRDRESGPRLLNPIVPIRSFAAFLFPTLLGMILSLNRVPCLTWKHTYFKGYLMSPFQVGSQGLWAVLAWFSPRQKQRPESPAWILGKGRARGLKTNAAREHCSRKY